MVPVIQFSDTMNQGVDCLGPTGLVYCVDLKSAEIEPPTLTFERMLRTRLGELLVE